MCLVSLSKKKWEVRNTSIPVEGYLNLSVAEERMREVILIQYEHLRFTCTTV
jgi:hypothetical protein